MKTSTILKIALLLVIFCFLTVHKTVAQPPTTLTITLQPDSQNGKDAFVHGLPANQTINFGNDPFFTSSAWTFNGLPGTIREYVDFDLSSIPTCAMIHSATLSLFGATTSFQEAHSCLFGPNDYVIRRVTSPWNEQLINWNTQPSTTSLHEKLQPSLCTPDAGVDIDMKSLITDYVSNPSSSYGFQMALQDESFYRRLVFHSSDAPEASVRPKLTVVYSIPCPCENTIVLKPDSLSGKDTYAHGEPSRQNNNYGSVPSFNAVAWTWDGSPGALRQFFDFNLASIPATADIISANLKLFGKTEANGSAHSCLSGNNDYKFSRVTSDWNENTLTWNNQPNTTSLHEVLMPALCTANSDVVVSLKELVQDYIDNPSTSFGFQMALQNEEFYRALIFHSSEAVDPSKRPELTIKYAMPMCRNNIVKNGSFSQGLVPGNLGGAGSCNHWSPGFETPQVITGDTCANAGAMLMWGNQVVGEGIYQEVNFTAGKKYVLTFCGNWHNAVQDSVRLRFRATSGSPATNYQNCPTGCEEIYLSPILSTTWNTYTATWIPLANYDHLNISVWNNFTIDDGAYVSWARIDGVCISEDCPVNTEEIQSEVVINAKIYPNPIADYVDIQFDRTLNEDVQFTMYNLNGQLVKSKLLVRGLQSERIFIDNLPSGTYFVVFRSTSGTVERQKLIKI